MSDTKENMVLRTVYLPLDLDRELRQLAFSRDVSKADLIRDFIHQGLGNVEASGEKTLAAKVQERIREHNSAIETAAGSKRTFSGSKEKTSRHRSSHRRASAGHAGSGR
ncbi:MAG TPA: CopG family transcriptional regulator [Sphingomicrobium sp.]|nr:CopG family transcriptional regulator [Sphingomicrobium sp.]